MVLRDRANPGQHARERQHVLQPERRRCLAVAVSRGPGRQRSRLLRSHLGEHQRAFDLAGHAPQQDRRLLGRAVGVPEVRGRDHRHHHAAGRLARGDRARADAAAARAAGHVDVAADQPPAVRCRLRRHLLRLGQLRAGSEPHARSDPHHGTVRGGLRQQRRPRQPGLPLAGLGRQPHRLLHLEGIGRLRHRHPQRQSRLSGHADDRRPHVVLEQPEPVLPVQQRHPQPAHPGHLAVDQRRACRLGRDLRPGAVDDAPADAAGRAAIRRRAQLVPGAEDRADPVPAGGLRLPGDQGRRQLQGHHAADGRGVGRLRHRQDGCQDELREVPRRCRRVS